MYARFLTKTNDKEYGTQRGMESGKYHMYTEDKKYMLDESFCKKEIKSNYSRLFESQFFQKIKVPEQAKVVQNTIANDGR